MEYADIHPDKVSDGGGAEESCEFHAVIQIWWRGEYFELDVLGSLVGDPGPGSIRFAGVELYEGGHVEIAGRDVEENVDIGLECTLVDGRRWNWQIVRTLVTDWWRLLHRGIFGPFARHGR